MNRLTHWGGSFSNNVRFTHRTKFQGSIWSWILNLEHWRAVQMMTEKWSFRRGTMGPSWHQKNFGSLEIFMPFSAEGIMSTSSPGSMPTRIIALGKINLDKLKTTLCPNIKQSRSSHFFIQFFIVIVSRQPDYGSRLYFSYSLAGHEINRKSLDKWVKLWVDYFKDVSIGVNCIPDPFKAVISKHICDHHRWTLSH